VVAGPQAVAQMAPWKRSAPSKPCRAVETWWSGPGPACRDIHEASVSGSGHARTINVELRNTSVHAAGAVLCATESNSLP
jgi:hypothetical protein